MAKATKVLLIEDNVDLLDIIHQFLDAYGFNVVSAKDGAQGLELFASEHPDIILSDVLLPRVNGFQVCEKVKHGDNPVPVVLMSALYKTYNLQQEAKTKYGADEYLIKPLNLIEVAKLLCRLLGIDRPEHVEEEEAEEPVAAPAKKVVPGSAALHLLDDEPEGESDALAIAPSLPAPPSRGELAEHPVENLLGHLFRESLTAKLKVTVGDAVRTAYLKAGVPVYVNSNVSEENFTQLLVDDGKLTAEQLERIANLAAERGATVGKMLVENGFIDQSDLSSYLLREVDHRLMSLLNVRAGLYQIQDDDSWLAKIKRPELDVFEIVYRSVMRNLDETTLKTRYDEKSDAVVGKHQKNLPLAGQIAWLENHLEAFMFIDGESTTAEIIANSEQSEFVVFQLLYTLELFDMIRFR
jgi:CheY-like chemotaxis protein